MAPIKIGINGFGRIGRLVARAALSKPDLVEIVAVNDPFLDTHYASYQFQYDSVHGKYPTEVTYDKENIIIDGKKVRVYNEKDPENIPWGELGVEYVCESTGIFLDLKVTHTNTHRDSTTSCTMDEQRNPWTLSHKFLFFLSSIFFFFSFCSGSFQASDWQVPRPQGRYLRACQGQLAHVRDGSEPRELHQGHDRRLQRLLHHQLPGAAR